MTSTDLNKPGSAPNDTKGASNDKGATKAAIKVWEFHPYADLFPLLDKDSVGFKALIEDIKENSQHQPIILYEGKILDGRNRYNACQHLGIDVRTSEYIGKDPIGFVLSINLHRRHLNTSQRALVAARLADLELGANQQTLGTSIEVAAKLLNVGRASVERAKQLLKNGDPSAIKAVEGGTATVTGAAGKSGTGKSGKGGTGKGEKGDKDEPSASDKYDRAETKLIEKLKDLKPAEADAAANATIKKLKDIVAIMLKAAPSAKAA